MSFFSVAVIKHYDTKDLVEGGLWFTILERQSIMLRESIMVETW